MSDAPTISVVVALISGHSTAVRRCLAALSTQRFDGSIEVLVPFDEACREVTSLAADFPRVRFLPAPGLDTTHARKGYGREHHDSLRTIGLRAATAPVIALIEDHAYPADTWCAELMSALARHPQAAAVGGAVECGNRGILGLAVWFCDFGRYQNPLADAPAEYVSDSNVAYRKQALEQTASAWAADYHETAVHGAMAAAGMELRTTPKPVVWQARSDIRWAAALTERYVWGRSYSGTRARLIGGRRWLLAALTPALPAVLTARSAQVTLARGRGLSGFLRACPAILALQTAWSLGELVGYVTSSPGGQPGQ
jgi:hypothetical protein